MRRIIKQRLGVVPQGDTLDTELTVEENLRSFGAYHGLARGTAQLRVDELLTFVQLAGRADARVGDLSGGMQRRLLIARALVNDPDLVVLDEPTTGLDLRARHLIWDRLRSLKAKGKTLILTTHYMEEAAQLCDRIAIVRRGRILAEGSPDELLKAHLAPRVVEVHGVDTDLLRAVRAAVQGLLAEVEQLGDRVLIYSDDSQQIAARLSEHSVGQSLLLRDAPWKMCCFA
jgi:lipooligosaccharide transport system ATP-binding protein